MNIFLGEPSANIKAWIIAHHNPGPAGHADTIFTFTGNKIANLNINGELGSSIWKEDEDTYEVILDYEGSEKFAAHDLVSVDIGNTVTSIVSYAFAECSGLTNITIPDSVTSIGSYAFSGCTHLASVTIDKSMAQVESMANKYWNLGVGEDDETGDEITFQVTIHCNDNQDIVINPES